MAELPSTLLEVYIYAPPSAMISFWAATSFPVAGVAPHLARRMAGCRLAWPMYRLAAAPDDLDRALQFPGGQRDHDLYREVFNGLRSAPPMAGVDDAYAFDGQSSGHGQSNRGRRVSTVLRRRS